MSDGTRMARIHLRQNADVCGFCYCLIALNIANGLNRLMQSMTAIYTQHDANILSQSVSQG